MSAVWPRMVELSERGQAHAELLEGDVRRDDEVATAELTLELHEQGVDRSSGVDTTAGGAVAPGEP